MHYPTSQKKQKLHTMSCQLQFWGIILSLAISVAVSAGAGVNYYYKFDEGNPRVAFILLMLLLCLVSFVTLFIVVNVLNNIVLSKTLHKHVEDDSSPRHNSRVGLENVEDYEYSGTDTTKVSMTFVKTQKNYQQYIDDAYQTDLNQLYPNQYKFQTTEFDQPVSQNSENMSVEFIKQRLLEKETRIIKIIDINVDKNSNHMYDFSAKIYVMAESLTDAAEIVDSANTILEYEFNMKDTKLIPVISK